jgi:hypothetical protein
MSKQGPSALLPQGKYTYFDFEVGEFGLTFWYFLTFLEDFWHTHKDFKISEASLKTLAYIY